MKNHRTKRSTIAGLAITIMGLLGITVLSWQPAQAFKGDHHKSKDIVETAVSAGTFNTLVKALQAADLVDALKGDGPFTVFAPTDEAFAKIPAATLSDLLKCENKDKLKAILLYHVVSGKYAANDVVKLNGRDVTTLQGDGARVKVKGNAVMLDEAQVVKTDIMTSNGVIHVIDTVIMPN